MKITIKKIAEIAGVHPATVDKVLHNRPGVSNEVRERVQKLIDELGYKPNPAGRVLQQQGKEFVIAAILVEVDALPYIKIRDNFPEIEIVTAVESFEDPETTYQETLNLLRSCPDLDGLYITCGGVSQVGRAVRESGRSDLKTLSFEKYPEILELLRDDIIDVTIDSELERQGELPVQIIMNQLVLKKAPPSENIFTDIRILIKECLF